MEGREIRKVRWRMMTMRMRHHYSLVLLVQRLCRKNLGSRWWKIPSIEIEICSILLGLIGTRTVSWRWYPACNNKYIQLNPLFKRIQKQYVCLAEVRGLILKWILLNFLCAYLSMSVLNLLVLPLWGNVAEELNNLKYSLCGTLKKKNTAIVLEYVGQHSIPFKISVRLGFVLL